MNLIDVVNKKYQNPNVEKLPKFRTGDTIAVSCRVKEGEKERIQVFEGICISMKNPGNLNGHFRVRKISSGGIGVERVFPFHSPLVASVKITSFGKSRRAKHFYLRDREGKRARIAVDFTRK